MISKIMTLILISCFFFGCGKNEESQPEPRATSQQDRNVQPLLNEIHDVVQKAVDAGIPDQIPGIHRGDDILTVSVSGVECGQHVNTIQEAVSLLKTNLVAKFEDKMIDSKQSNFPPDGEVVLQATLETEGWLINVDIPVFKRTSKRVILFPVYLARRKDSSNN